MGRMGPSRWGKGIAMAAAALVACAEIRDAESPPPLAESDSARVDSLLEPEAGVVHRRTIAFMDVASDTATFVPWDFENRVEDGEMLHSVRGWLGRTGEWEMFVREDWSTEPVGAPWRLFPHGSARIVMGFGDLWQEIYFVEGLRDVSIRPGPPVAEWVGGPSESYRVLAGSAVLSGREISGLVLDASTAFAADSVAVSEMAFLAGDGLRLLVANGNRPDRRRGWALVDDSSIALPLVEVSWPRTVAPGGAGRRIPVVWRIESRMPSLSGEVEAISSHLHFGEREDADAVVESPLPLVGMYEVRGEVTVGAALVQVSGLVRHSQR